MSKFSIQKVKPKAFPQAKTVKFPRTKIKSVNFGISTPSNKKSGAFAKKIHSALIKKY